MGGRGRVALAVFVLLCLGACVTARGSGRFDAAPAGNEEPAPVPRADRGEGSDSRMPTLLVESSSAHHIAVRLNGVRLGTATWGLTCIRIPQAAGQMVLGFVRLGGDPQLAWPVRLEESLHWRVQLRPGNSLKYDVLSLTPAERSCRT